MAKTVRYYIDVDESGAIRGGKNVEKQLGRVDESSQKTGASAVALGNIMADAAMKMVGSLAQVVSQSQELFSRQEQAEQKVQAVIKATSGAAGFGIDELKTYAAELQQYTTIGDESFLESMSTMLTFRKVTGDTFKDAIELAADTSQIFGSLESATLQIGKALEDPIEGMTALRRVGVTFSEQQKEQVKNFLAQNDLASAQAVILDNLRGQVGGVAREMSQTPTGKWEQFLNTLGDSQEDFGEIITRLKVGLIPTLEGVLSVADGVVNILQDWMGLDLKSQLEEERASMNGLVLTITGLNEGNERRAKLMGELIEKYPEFNEYISGEKANNDELIGALQKVNLLYIERSALMIADEDIKEKQAEAGAALAKQWQMERDLMEKLNTANEELGLGVDITTGSYQDRLTAVKEALAVDAEFRESLKGGKTAKNEEAELLQELTAFQYHYAGQIRLVARTQREAGDAAAYRKAIEESLSSEENPEQKTGAIVYESPELPEISNPEMEPLHLPIEIDLPEFEPLDLSAEILSDGTIETLNRQLAQVDLMPDKSINDLQEKLNVVKELHSAAQTDAERERLALAEQGIQRQLQARQTGITEEQILLEEHYEIVSEQLNEVFNGAMNLYANFASLQAANTEAELSRIDKEKKSRLKSIDAQLKNEKLTEKQREELVEKRSKIEFQYEERTNSIKKEQYEKEKRANTYIAIAETAIAVTEALPNIPLSIAAGIAGALQVAVIRSQPNPYFDGGPVLERMPEGMTTPGKKIISINETSLPEYVVKGSSTQRFMPVLDLINYQPDVAEQVLMPMFEAPSVSSMYEQNVFQQDLSTTERFAFGGFTDSSAPLASPVISSFAERDLEIPVIETINSEQISDAIAAGFENLKANFKLVAEGTELRAVQDETASFEGRQIVSF
ncbi:MAG: hypothetical protein ABJI69_00350 [Balneola sp.]